VGAVEYLNTGGDERPEFDGLDGDDILERDTEDWPAILGAFAVEECIIEEGCL
jgi:hypothetical protein